MKKIAVLALSLVSVSAVKAQDTGGFRIGVKAGATYSNISGKNVSQITGPNYDTSLDSYKLGYNAGVGLSIPLSADGVFAFAPELLYNRKGYQIESKQTSGLASGVESVKSKQTRVLHYLDVPLLAKMNVGGLFFELGPQVSYLFGSKTKRETTTKYLNGDKTEVKDDDGFLDYSGIKRGPADKSDLAQFDIAGVAGVGYMTDGGLSVNLRYARGFNSLLDTKGVPNDKEPKAFNNAFTLQVGYLLPLGK
ncbi:PorT family protein [Hymenobacter sp. BT664]|uniref:PorT family protein n=1 Tax=Hymenobacter montanus TaxID=2771359 RepID=A0A927BEY7_9BACT|nr:porin family protein [Hymenobacter montanus]MBD2768733.1 PorT family protein [Hymenobacter montanus]